MAIEWSVGGLAVLADVPTDTTRRRQSMIASF